jgi:DNA-directed RNA polymerase specialized sigma24 family protein
MTAPAPGLLQARFLAVLPVVQKHARFAFRALVCGQERDDAVAEVIALVWNWYCRLLKRGKEPDAFITTLALFASRHVKAGRRLCGTEGSHDVLSRPAQ